MNLLKSLCTRKSYSPLSVSKGVNCLNFSLIILLHNLLTISCLPFHLNTAHPFSSLQHQSIHQQIFTERLSPPSLPAHMISFHLILKVHQYLHNLGKELESYITPLIHRLFHQDHMKKFFKFCDSRKMLWYACYKKKGQINLSGSDAKGDHSAALCYFTFLESP